jgi:pyruvate formate lyase activating enzyme
MDRREFMRNAGCSAALVALAQSDLLPAALGGLQNACAFGFTKELSSIEARHYKKLPGGGIECGICPRHCKVTDLERGYCGTRENRKDIYHTLVYGLACTANIDPIEKKPLFHFHPGTDAFSLASAGCNVNCKCCQNWEISQSRPEQTDNFSLSPQEIASACRDKKIPSIAYTYSEPTVFYEYMFDTAQQGHKQGVRSVMISNGYIEAQPLAEILPHLDAIKVDLKGIRETYYHDYVDGELKPVLDSLLQIRKSGVWLELVYLVIPSLNDSDAEFTELASWIKGNLGDDVPLHFSQFHPEYLLKNLPPTPQNTLERAHDIAKTAGLQFVYLGNLPGHPAESTYCPACGKMLIERRGYQIYQNNLSGSTCRFCRRDIPGRFI